MGTVLRGAQAFGAGCVALGPGCADPHSPKAVRASMGAIFAVALARVTDLAQLPGVRIALVRRCDERAARTAREAQRRRRRDACWWAPSARGCRRTVVCACERVARIPIAADSLNAAMAATVALYEMTRDAVSAPPSSRVRAS